MGEPLNQVQKEILKIFEHFQKYQVLQGVSRSGALLGHPFSLDWVVISGIYFRGSKYDVLGLLWCMKVEDYFSYDPGNVGSI